MRQRMKTTKQLPRNYICFITDRSYNNKYTHLHTQTHTLTHTHTHTQTHTHSNLCDQYD